MIRVLVLLSLLALLVCFTYYEYPDAFTNFYNDHIMKSKSWGKVELVEEKHSVHLEDFFKSKLFWQILENFIGTAIAVLICVLIGWKANSYRSLYEKTFESSLTEYVQRQNILEKQLQALELQIVDFERNYLSRGEKTSLNCHNCERFSFLGETIEQIPFNKSFEKGSQTSKSIGMVSQEHGGEALTEETDAKKPFTSLNRQEGTREFGIPITNKKSFSVFDQTKELLPSILNNNTSIVYEINTENASSNDEKYYEIQGIEFENEEGEMDGASNEIDVSEYMNEFNQEEMNYSYSIVSRESLPSESNSSDPKENLSNTINSIVGAGECDETFRGKIVPVSQIPQYQELWKSNKQKTKAHKVYDDNNSVPFITCSKTPDEVLSERTATPQVTPRRSNSISVEGGVDGPGSKSRRRKQRS